MKKPPEIPTLHLIAASCIMISGLLCLKSTDIIREFLVPAAHAQSAPVSPMPVAAPISDQERQLLQELRARKHDLDARAQSLATREAALTAAEATLAGRLQDLKNLQNNLQKLQDAANQRDDANWQGLVSVYEAMKPSAAAAILNNLDMPVMLQIFNRMKDRKAAMILSDMDADRAREVTVQLAKMRALQTNQNASTS